MAYIHGAYGELASSKVTNAQQGNVVAAYIGVAPVNLIRGSPDANIINVPVKAATVSAAL